MTIPVTACAHCDGQVLPLDGELRCLQCARHAPSCGCSLCVQVRRAPSSRSPGLSTAGDELRRRW